MFALIITIDVKTRLSCLCRQLHFFATHLDRTKECTEVLNIVKYGLVGDLIMGVTNYYHGRMYILKVFDGSNILRKLCFFHGLDVLVNEAF